MSLTLLRPVSQNRQSGRSAGMRGNPEDNCREIFQIRKTEETMINALPRQGESEKNMEFQYVKPKALMLI